MKALEIALEIVLWVVNLLLFILILAMMTPEEGRGAEPTKCEALLNKCNATMRDLANCDAKFTKECE